MNLIAEMTEIQVALEEELDNAIKISNIIKNKKKLISEEFKELQQELIKYVNLLIKPDFITQSIL